MRLRFVFIFLLAVLGGTAQIKVEKILYRDDSVYVYPVNLGYNYDSQDGEGDIPLIFDSLPTGKYVIQYYYGDELETAGDFFISNGKVNGVGHFGNKVFNYVDGIRNGDYYYVEYLGGITVQGQYVEGVRHGVFKYYNYSEGRMNLEKEQEYTFGQELGQLKLYYPNGQIRVDCEKYGKQDRNVNMPYQENPKDNFDLIFNNLPIGYYDEVRNKFWEEFPKHLEDTEGVDRIKTSTTRGFYSSKLYGNYKVYFPDGTIAEQGVLDSTSNKWDMSRHFAIYRSGKPIYSLDSIVKDSVVFFTKKNLQDNGKVKNETVYTRDKYGKVSRYSSKNLNRNLWDNKSYVNCWNYYGYNSILRNEFDGIIPTTIYEYEDGSFDTIAFFITNTNSYYNKPIALERNKITDLDVMINDSSQIQFKRSIVDTTIGLEMVFYYSEKKRDKDYLIPFSFGKEFFNWGSNWGLVNLSFCRGYGYPSSLYDEDSIIIKKNGELFSGDIIFKNGTKRKIPGLFEEDKNNLNYYSSKRVKKNLIYYGLVRNRALRKFFKVKRRKKIRKAKEYSRASFKNGVLNGWINKNSDSLYYEQGDLKKSIEYSKSYNTGVEFKSEIKSFDKKQLNGEVVNWINDRFAFEKPKKKSKKYPYGTKTFYKKYSGLSSIKTYENGLIKGVNKEWSASDYFEHFEDSLEELKTKSIILPFSKLDTAGTIGLVEVSYYDSSKFQGVYRRFEEGGISKYIEYNKGEYNGLALDVSWGDTLESRIYNAGIQEGKYFKKYDDGGLEIEGFYKTGEPNGEWSFYSKYGKKNAIVLIDSLKKVGVSYSWCFDDSYGRSGPRFDEFNLSDLNSEGVCGTLSLFHSNEQKLAQGELTSGVRTGAWSFWNEHGEKVEDNYYKNDTITVDSIEHYSQGNYTLFNIKGDTIAKGKLLGEVDLYDCSSDLKIREYDRSYDVFISNNSDTLVKNGEGYVKFYDEFNLLQQEGGVSKGLKHSDWKMYDPNGNLNSVGKFYFGKKDGVWYEGDLRAIQYKDPDCFVHNEDYSETKEMERVTITRSIYNKGILLNKSTLTTYRRK